MANTYLTTLLPGFNYFNKLTVANDGATLATNKQYICDTSGGSFTVRLPQSPANGHAIILIDGNDWSTNNLIVGRNQTTFESIEGVAQDLQVDVAGCLIYLVYDGSTWEISATVGSRGYSGYSGSVGTSGYSGYSGIGTSGYSGISGFSGIPIPGTVVYVYNTFGGF